MKAYGKIKFIESIMDAPKDAYIIRKLGDGSVRLEHYYIKEGENHKDTLKDYPVGAFGQFEIFDDDEEFEETLIDARQVIGNRRIIHVVKETLEVTKEDLEDDVV